MIVLNPIMSGGLSLTKLQAATATPADVLAEKTFYSGAKTLKTGTLTPRYYTSGSVRIKDYGETSQTINLGFVPSMCYVCGVFNQYGWVNGVGNFVEFLAPYKGSFSRSSSINDDFSASLSGSNLTITRLDNYLDLIVGYYAAR